MAPRGLCEVIPVEVPPGEILDPPGALAVDARPGATEEQFDLRSGHLRTGPTAPGHLRPPHPPYAGGVAPPPPGVARVVEDEDLCVAHHRLCKGQLLPLSDAHLLTILERLPQDGLVAPRQARDEAVGAGGPGGGPDPAVVRGPGDVTEPDVVGHG